MHQASRKIFLQKDVRDLTEFEKVITQHKDYLLGQCYKLLLQYETKMEQVEVCMIKWMQNIDSELFLPAVEISMDERYYIHSSSNLKRKLVQDVLPLILYFNGHFKKWIIIIQESNRIANKVPSTVCGGLVKR